MDNFNTVNPNTPPEAQPAIQQQNNNKGQNTILLILAILLILIMTGLVGYIAYIYGKNTGQEKDTDTTDNTNTSTVIATTVVDPYEGWETCENSSWIISVKHPSDWDCELTSDSATNQYSLILTKDDKEISFQNEYAFSPSEDSGCTSEIINITTIEFGGLDIDLGYCEEGSYPPIFYQITYDYDITPPEYFWIIGTGFETPTNEEIQTLKLIFDSITLED